MLAYLRVMLGLLIFAGFYMSGIYALMALADKDWKKMSIGLALVAFFVLSILNFP